MVATPSPYTGFVEDGALGRRQDAMEWQELVYREPFLGRTWTLESLK